MSKKNDKRRAKRAPKHGSKHVVKHSPRKGFVVPSRRLVESRPLTNDEEMHAILEEYGLPYDYPEQVAAEAESIEPDLTEQEFSKRLDMREVCTFTIDPLDAKDFDDALSIRPWPGEEDKWEVGVHIADVTHYVRPGSRLEEEARERATSVYLVDRTIPMLPERLCNGICSLRPDEEKLTYSVVFRMDSQAQVEDYRICRSVIRSNRRLTYEEAQSIIEQRDSTALCGPEILELDCLAKLLRAERFRHGSIAFERAELRFDIDADGKPIGVHFRESKDAHKLVEEFMLLANRTVATTIGRPGKGKKAKSFVYRIHDVPNPDKLESLQKLTKRFGYDLRTQGDRQKVQDSINQLLKDVREKPEENLIEMLAIRSMAKAVYSTENIGHYGLGFPFYTHFTSPIRRYPDMMVHRLLARYLDGEKQPGWGTSEAALEEMCQHSSEREQLATNAERDSIKYKQVEFMQDKKDQVFEGVINGVVEWGFYVELTENGCEGLVGIRSLAGKDRYYFDEDNYCLRCQHGHKQYRLGDKVQVKVARADLKKKQLDFVLCA